MQVCNFENKQYSKNESGSYTFLDIDSVYATSITHKYYFENLTENHSLNDDGSCTFIAAEILLSFYDTFYCDDIVPEDYEFKASYPSNNIVNFDNSPGSGKGLDRPLRDELISIADDLNYLSIIPNDYGLNHIQLRGVIDGYFYNREINGTTYFSPAKQFIKSAIDNGDPVIVPLSGHTVVAYGYNSDYVWVHTGYHYTRAVAWSDIDLEHNWSIRLAFGEPHVHSDNYFNSSTHQYICPSHGPIRGEIDIQPTDFGFPDKYADPYAVSYFQKYGKTINTQRYRCGYIHNEYVNISPKKIRYGQAYLMCMFDLPITKISFNISYWQILDVLDPNNSTAELIFMDYEGEYWDYDNKIDLLSLSLPTDRNNQLLLNYSFTARISGFYIRATSPAVGDRNLGRISLGEIDIVYDVVV